MLHGITGNAEQKRCPLYILGTFHYFHNVVAHYNLDQPNIKKTQNPDGFCVFLFL